MARATKTSFDHEMEAHQTNWRKTNCVNQIHGQQNKNTYAWVLPQGAWEEGLWKELRQGASYPLAAHLRREKIQKHSGVHNLKSSWVLCANLYWPFGQSEEGRALLASFLQDKVDPSIERVTKVELEWAGKGDLSPEKLLGESGGQRGSGQTSPDIAFFIETEDGQKGVVLTENKFVEHSFYRCSARRTKDSGTRLGNPDTGRCERPADVIRDHASACHQQSWGRKYWQVLAPAANVQSLCALKACPGAYAGYQLLRQQALAEALAQNSDYDPVISCVAYDGRNTTLQGSLKSTGLAHFKDWGLLFAGKAKFVSFTHQTWMAWVKAHDRAGAWRDWLAFIGARYDL